MISQQQVQKLLSGQILDPGTQWSLGTFGGIAEFSRNPDEAVKLTTLGNRISAVTDRGAVVVEAHERLRPVASESITKQSWSHRVALCLPMDICAMNRRDVLTELGPDRGALREPDREAILFDLGFDALQADLCIRTSDPDAIANLRSHAGRSVFESGNPAMGFILRAQPHRVFISRIGRLEVYQPIPPATGNSPDGPILTCFQSCCEAGVPTPLPNRSRMAGCRVRIFIRPILPRTRWVIRARSIIGNMMRFSG